MLKNSKKNRILKIIFYSIIILSAIIYLTCLFLPQCNIINKIERAVNTIASFAIITRFISILLNVNNNNKIGW